MTFFIIVLIYITAVGVAVYGGIPISGDRSITLQQDSTMLKFSLGILCILTCLRGRSVGNDTSSYYEMFLYYSDNSSGTIYSDERVIWFNQSVEIGWQILNRLVAKFAGNYQILLAIVAIFSYLIIAKFINKYSDNVFISVILFFALCYGIYVNLLRQEIALSIILLAYEDLIEGKKGRFIFKCLVASLFHSSALFCVLMIFITRDLKRNTAISLVITSCILTILRAPSRILSALGYSGQYMKWESGYSTVFAIVLSAIILLWIIILLQGRVVCTEKEKECEENVLMNVYTWSALLVLCLSILGLDFPILFRISYYFYPFYVVGIPAFIKNNNMYSIEDKALYEFIIFIIIMIYKIGVILIRPEWVTEFQYVFFWN